MMRSRRANRRFGFLGALCASTLFLLAGAAPASAAAPAWKLIPKSNATAQAGQPFVYYLSVRNVGSVATDGTPYTLTVTLPDGMTGAEASVAFGELFECSDPSGDSVIVCEGTKVWSPANEVNVLRLSVNVDGEASGFKTAGFEISGGGAATTSTTDSTTISPDPAPFGIEAFGNEVHADPFGALFTQAAGHPYDVTTSIGFNAATDPRPLVGILRSPEAVRDILVDLPPGLVGNPTAASRCKAGELANTGLVDPLPLCPPSAQVGVAFLVLSNTVDRAGLGGTMGPVPVFNMEPPPHAPARFGMNIFGALVTIDANVRSGADYGVTVGTINVSSALPVTDTEVSLWGVPADDERHEFARSCEEGQYVEKGGETCPSDHPPLPFLRNPTSCAPSLRSDVRADSWENPGVFVSESHLGDGIDDCADVPFTPSIEVEPTTNAADSPSGLSVDLSVPQSCWGEGEVETLCQSDLRDAEVTLPAGMSVNPASADGLGVCTESQIGHKQGTSAPIEFSPDPAQCPNNSKIGEVEIETPLLEEPLEGAVYLAEQGENPFDSLLAMYLVAEGSGVVVKQAGEIAIGADGRLTTRFEEAPQTPFSNLHVELFGGPRAPLRTPPACGTHTTTASLVPWSGNAAAEPTSSFQIASGPGGGACPSGGFDPKLRAGTAAPFAGAFSPFSLRLTREDGTVELNGLSATLPPGLLARFAGIPYCSDASLASVSGGQGTGAAQIASPSCPVASQVGTVTVGAGAGPSPIYVSSARAYLAGPYKGAPLSIAVIAPAVAGPFDLGSVVVRNAVYVDPVAVRGRVVADPLPTALHGIPLDLRDIRVQIDRDQFTLNPTSCDPMAIDALVEGVGGASAALSQRFQAANCADLPFKPRLSLRLKGKVKRASHPRLIARLVARPGDANIARAQVTLPRATILDQAHIRTVCTRVQFAADACPKGSVYGRVRATSPLVDYTLAGPVYLRSSNNPLPDLVAVLRGPAHQPIEVELSGRTESARGALQNTFDLVPDAPVSRFRLELFGGKRGLIQPSTDLCARAFRVKVLLDGQNGKAFDTRPKLRTQCGGKQRKRGKKGRR